MEKKDLKNKLQLVQIIIIGQVHTSTTTRTEKIRSFSRSVMLMLLCCYCAVMLAC